MCICHTSNAKFHTRRVVVVCKCCCKVLVNGQGKMPTVEGKPSLVSAFSEEEYRKGIAALKYNKAAGIYDILVEQLKNLGPKAHKWLHTMLNTCFIENKITKIWRQSKIIAILKDSVIPKNYRPISLMCHTYKLYERLILNRVSPLLEQHLIKEQVGFRPGKSCTSQLLNTQMSHILNIIPIKMHFFIIIITPIERSCEAINS